MTAVVLLLFCVAPARAQADSADTSSGQDTIESQPSDTERSETQTPDAGQQTRDSIKQFNSTADQFAQRVVDAEAELKALNKAIADEKSPINAQLRDLDEQYKKVRRELETISRQVAKRVLEHRRLDERIKGRMSSAKFISDRFDQYIREFEATIHVAELQLHEDVLTDAKKAMENLDLGSRDRFDVQKAVIEASLTRLEDLQGGMIYKGTAIDSEGVLGKPGAFATGSFAQFGPVVLFTDTTGELQGAVRLRVGTTYPEVLPFVNEDYFGSVQALVDNGEGVMALDTTLGEAQTAEAIQEETLLDKFNAGGPVMYPILGLGIATLLVGLYKWIALTLTPSVSRGKLTKLLSAVLENQKHKAVELAGAMRGPTGRMLRAGVKHLGAPRDLIEEVMYEQVLSAKIKVNRLLPIIAICAAAAPLLGLLGTVSGIINTFKMMQISGGADMQNVSGGISEALLTTMFGLIVAIPSLILHVFLTRKARGVVDGMEMAGVALINEIMKSEPPSDPDRLAALSGPSPDGDSDTPPTEPTPKESQDVQTQAETEDTEPSSDVDEKEPEPALVESRAQ